MLIKIKLIFVGVPINTQSGLHIILEVAVRVQYRPTRSLEYPQDAAHYEIIIIIYVKTNTIETCLREKIKVIKKALLTKRRRNSFPINGLSLLPKIL